MASVFDATRHELYAREAELGRPSWWERIVGYTDDGEPYEIPLSSHSLAKEIIEKAHRPVFVTASREDLCGWTEPMKAPSEDAREYYQALSRYGEVLLPRIRTVEFSDAPISPKSKTRNRLMPTDYEVIVPLIPEDQSSEEVYSIHGFWTHTDVIREYSSPHTFVNNKQREPDDAFESIPPSEW